MAKCHGIKSKYKIKVKLIRPKIMEIKEFVENFANQFDETDLSAITVATVFKDLEEWSSLTALSIIAMVDEEYDVTLKGDDIRNATTVKDLYDIVKGRSK